MPSNIRMILSIFRRNFVAYFINPTGYVFITVFILLGAIAAFWQSGFFLNNLANLDQLNAYYPLLLLFFVPALTMNVWSEERRQGTEELLFTLPGRDVDIVLGKYLAVLGIFTVAVVFSLSHVVILWILGQPDLGLMISTYIGYWLSGAALLAVGMVASLLTSNATVAFILGALFCAAFVFVDTAESVVGGALGSILRNIGIRTHFAPFGGGLLPLASILYFVGLGGVMIYLNVALVGRRHVRGGERSATQAAHVGVRSVALAASVMALFIIVHRWGWSIDSTAERLHTLQPQTSNIVDVIPEDRPVIIQAFFSKNVPEGFVQTRKNLVNALNRLSDVGGDRVQVAIHDTEPFSDTAQNATQNYGIVPQRLMFDEGSQRTTQDVYLGLVFTSGPDEFVVPFFDRGLPVEYEIARSIRVVSQTARKKVGVVATDANMFGGFDFQSMTSRPDWSFVRELRKQYEVVQVPAAGPYPGDLDALVVALPSSLAQPELGMLRTAIMDGTPTLILDDPLPMFNPNLSPNLPKDAGRNPFQSQGQPPAPPKGDFDGFLAELGLTWSRSRIVWDSYNPHPAIGEIEPEVVFVAPSPENPVPFRNDSVITEGLQEVVMLFPGQVRVGSTPTGATLSYVPLMHSGLASGFTDWNSLLTQSFFGLQINPNPRRVRANEHLTLAMQVEGSIDVPVAPPSVDPDSSEGDEGTIESERTVDTAHINLIFVPDVDVISETFFDLRRRGFSDLNFDNVTFALNCIDVLAGDESFVELRKHRPQHRVLTRVEAQSRQYEEARRAQTEQAEQEAQQQIEEAQQRLNEKVSVLRNRTDLDDQTKAIMLRTLESTENRKLDVTKANIEREKSRRIDEARREMELAVLGIQRGIKWWAALLPPVPTLLLAIVLFAHRYKRERVSVNERRSVVEAKSS